MDTTRALVGRRGGARTIAALLALLLTLPLLATTPGTAQAEDDDEIYTTRWLSQGGHDWGTNRGTTLSSVTGRLQRSVTPDGTLEGVTESFDVDPPGAVDLEDCDDDAFAGTISEPDERTCEFAIDLPEGPDGAVTVTSTLTADGDVEVESVVTYTRTGQSTEVFVGGEPAVPPIAVTPGDELEIEVEIDNLGAVDLEMMDVFFRNDGFGDLVADCDPADPDLLSFGDDPWELTCTFGEVTQWTSTTLHVQSRPLPALDGIIRVGTTFDDFLDLQLDPGATISATATPSTVYDGDASDVAVTLENSGDVAFSAIATDVRVDGEVACTLTGDDDIAVGETIDVGTCSVTPEPGESVTVGATELTYDVYEDTGLFGLDPIDVDLTSETTDLHVAARYGSVWGPDDTFTARTRFPVGDGTGFLALPHLEVTVSNDGTVDLDDVQVTSDLDGCAATLQIDAGESQTFHCDGPDVTLDELQVSTTVEATAQVAGDGPALAATDSASFEVFALELGATVDPDWDGEGVEVPYLLTFTNPAQVELPAVSSEPLSLAGLDCQLMAPGPLAGGDAVSVEGCTLLAGDLVTGVPLLGLGYDSLIAETAPASDLLEVQLDPWGAIEGSATLEGDALAGVEVQLRLLELLELPTTDLEAAADDPPTALDGLTTAMGSGNTATTASNGSGCAEVGDLTDGDVGSLVAATVTDAEGDLCFDLVPPGEYELVVLPAEGAELAAVSVAGQDGFATNSPAVSEPFSVGVGSAALGNNVEAELRFTAEEEPAAPEERTPEAGIEAVADDDVQTVTAQDREALPETGTSGLRLALVALLALLTGAVLVAFAGRRLGREH